jgi:hypothetical protein
MATIRIEQYPEGWRPGDAPPASQDVEYTPPPPTQDERLVVAEAAARIVTAKAILAEELEPEQVGEVAAIYPEWSAGEAVKIGDFRRYGDELYSCLQAHTTQSDWTPDITPALWRHWPKVAAGEEYPPWVQPTGSHDAYNTGDRVVYHGQNYESLIDANVWSPDAYPAGWKLI